MDTQQVKKLLKDGYERAGFDVVDEPENGETKLRYRHKDTTDILLRITADDVDEYAQLLNARGEFQAAPAPCSMASTNYREHLLITQRGDAASLRDVTYTVDGQGVVIERATPVFANYFRFHEGYMAHCIDRLFAMPDDVRQRTRQQALDIRATFARPLTIRTTQLNAGSLDQAIRQSDTAFDSGLFTLALEYDLPAMLATGWDAPHPRLRDKTLHTLHHIDHPFRRDVLQLYQAGLAAPLPSQQFLAYYHVLEFYLQDVDDGSIYQRLSYLLHAPDFTPDMLHIARIVDAVKAESTSAQVKLEALIQQHLSDERVQTFIEEETSSRSTAQSIAQRLTQIRDAVVGIGQEGTVPPAVDSSAIRRAVPIVKFLAERTLLAD